MSAIQSVVFPKSRFSLRDALSWLTRHEFKTDLDETTSAYRFRQVDPKKFVRYITRKTDNGPDLIIGYER